MLQVRDLFIEYTSSRCVKYVSGLLHYALISVLKILFFRKQASKQAPPVHHSTPPQVPEPKVPEIAPGQMDEKLSKLQHMLDDIKIDETTHERGTAGMRCGKYIVLSINSLELFISVVY